MSKSTYYLEDFPTGPLDIYRKRASFDWKRMKIFLETEEILEYQQLMYEELRKHPILFSSNYESPTLNEQRMISAFRSLTLNSIECLSPISQMDNLRKPSAMTTTLFQLDPSSAIKKSIGYGMFPSVLQSLGTDRHEPYLNASLKGDILGAYCLTEIGHGSNAKFMQTTATYDKTAREFVLNSPSFEAAKCWAGNVGQLATHAIVYAQLITPDGVNHSLHAFCVKIRDPETLLPPPGVTVGDMGEKIGLNGIDNGFIIFNNYRIPKKDLLNKTGDVTDEGVYVTPYRDPNKRYGASLGALSMGRVVITQMCSVYMSHALAIAVRYAAVRKQFGPDNCEEVPILEYQMHQFRLLPYLSVSYILKIFATYLVSVQYRFVIDGITGENKIDRGELGLELHAISSSSKPLAGWIVRDGIQECRESCAGHGYLKISGIGDIKNSHDANCTYEGENHVLIQQTSNWLLKFWPLILKKTKISSPLGSINFLTDAEEILKSKFNVSSVDDFISYDNISNLYRWLVCYLLKASHSKCENLAQNHQLDSFWVKNKSQVFYSQSLAVAYIQNFMLQVMNSTILEATDSAIRIVLQKLLSLYAIWSLQKHTSTFYLGGYTNDPLFVTLIQDSMLKLLESLKDDAVSLIDVIAPPDFLIKSVLGQSDGLVYKHLEDAFFKNPESLKRPRWWKDYLNFQHEMKSKL